MMRIERYASVSFAQEGGGIGKGVGRGRECKGCRDGSEEERVAVPRNRGFGRDGGEGTG